MEEYVVKTYPSNILFHLDPTDLPISTRDPSDFQEIQLNLQDIFSSPLNFYFHTSPEYLDHTQDFLFNFQNTIRIFSSISTFYSFDFFFRMGCTDKKWNDP